MGVNDRYDSGDSGVHHVLFLNAVIEVARAGAYGKGLAVRWRSEL